MDDPLDMSGKVVLVTGGAKGLGRGISEAFLAHGADVVACGRSEPDSLPSGDGRSAAFVPTDVRDAEAVAALVAGVVERHGRLDVVVNNAGGTPPAFMSGTSPRFHEAIIKLNLVAPLFVSQRANDVMQEQPEGGCIVNIASVNGMRAAPGNAAYGAAKAGLINLGESLAVEWAPKVRVNTVTLGIAGSDEIFAAYYGNDPARIAAAEAEVPLGRFASADDAAGACLFLASRLAGHISGANLLVHGGGEPTSTLPQR